MAVNPTYRVEKCWPKSGHELAAKGKKIHAFNGLGLRPVFRQFWCKDFRQPKFTEIQRQKSPIFSVFWITDFRILAFHCKQVPENRTDIRLDFEHIITQTRLRVSDIRTFVNRTCLGGPKSGFETPSCK